jgi:hypothetical protein
MNAIKSTVQQMDTVQKLRAVLLSFIILSFVCVVSISGVYVINRNMDKIGLWVISYVILSMYVLLRANTTTEFEEEYLILTIMTFMLWKDEKDEYFWTFMTVILSVNIILIGFVKIAKHFPPAREKLISRTYEQIL